MGVVVVGDLAHVVVEKPIIGSKDLVPNLRKARVHVRDIIDRWLGTVRAPHNHRDRAGFALGDPTTIVFVEPFGELCRLAKLAVRTIGHGRIMPATSGASTSSSNDGSTISR